MAPLKLGVLISGRGSNLQALIDAFARNRDVAEIGIVISNRPDAAGLARAAEAGIETAVIDHRAFSGREVFDQALSAKLESKQVELVCLAGFMRILTAPFIERWNGKILNIHPSLLPAFKGLNPHAQALAAGVRISGCSVHLVTGELDGGPILAQAAVPVLADDTEQTLAARILVQEHTLYPKVVQALARRQIRIEGGGIVLSQLDPDPDQALLSLS